MASTTPACNSVLSQLDNLNVIKQLEIMQNLYIMWEEVGVDEEQKLNRATQVWNHIFDMLNDIKKEEILLIQEVKMCVINYEKKISVLNAELQLPKTEKFNGSFIQQEQTLRQLLDELSKMKHKRLREFHELHLQELKYCEVLEKPPLNFTLTTGVPSEKDIYELQQHVKILQEETKRREDEFLKLIRELSTILKITELTPETCFEKEILTHQEDALSFSVEKLKQLQQIVSETRKKQIDLENEKFSLIEKLSVLWDSLKIDAKEREVFLSKHADSCISNLNALKNEIARCEAIKKQNYSTYLSLQEELVSLWNKCFILPSGNMLSEIQVNEINKDVLENYDNELKKWRKYYKDIQHIIQMIVKWQELWHQMLLFENKATDPNRFKNRGGNLLKEQKQRKQLKNELPKLEEKIIINIENYEKETGKHFLYFGKKFEDFIKEQWEDLLNQKENEKLTKKSMQVKELRTPTSKQSLSVMTPKSTRSKFLKSAGISIHKTPVSSNLRQSSHNTISHVKNKKMPSTISNKPKESILKEENRNNFVVNEYLDSTTYMEFVSKLNRSSRIYHRSSVLSSKMIIGTRASLNKIERRNGSKSIRKSLRKKH